MNSSEPPLKVIALLWTHSLTPWVARLLALGVGPSRRWLRLGLIVLLDLGLQLHVVELLLFASKPKGEDFCVTSLDRA